MSSCYKTSDNRYFNCAPMMQDGRQFTDYRQNCILNNKISQGKNSWEYRYFLTQNAVELQKKMILNQEQKTACTKCSDNTVLATNTVINCSPTGCSYQMNDPSGLGQYRQY